MLYRTVRKRASDPWLLWLVPVCALVSGELFATCPNPATGPDIVISDITSTNNFGQVGGIHAYSLTDLVCNFGTQNASWVNNTNQHPVMTQNMYRLSTVSGAARFEQVGMSWAYHEFAALAQSLCCACSAAQPPSPFILYPGCSSTNSANQTGSSTNLGPRFEINAFTGAFPYPFTSPAVPPTIGRRLQVRETDLDAALNPGALYFLEAHEVGADDIGAGNAANNATYRQVMVGPSPYALALASVAQSKLPAIKAWKTQDASVTETTIQIPGEGTLILSAKATFIGGGLWHYEYALYNFNSDRSVGLISILLPAAFPPSNIGFHDVDYHSGEPYVGTDWTASVNAGTLSWACESFAQNPNANAIRWGTTYNFRFDAMVGPKPGGGNVTLGLFKPGTLMSINALSVVPDQLVCEADTNHNGTVDIDDLVTVITAWGNCPAPPTACPADVVPPGGNGMVNIDDLVKVITSWGTCH